MGTKNKSVIIEDIVQFMKWAEQFENGNYLFRGVPSVCYPIEASAYRRLRHDHCDKNTPEDLLEINQDLIEEARRQGHHLKDGQQLWELDLLAELQHFGAATGLIDFTYNALVALWFACWKSPSEANKNGKVVVLRTDGLEPLKKVDYKLSQQKIEFFFRQDEAGRYALYQWQPRHQNNRIVAQQSVFVFGGAPIEIEAKCQIQAESSPEIMKRLEDISGITGTSLFSDFHGFAWLRAHDKPIVPTSAAKYYIQRGLNAFQEQKLDRAIKNFNRVIEDKKVNTEASSDQIIDAHFHRARAYWYRTESNKDIEDAIKDYTRVIEHYEKAIESDPECTDKLKQKLAKVYNNRGLAYGHKEKFNLDKAIEDYNKAVDLDSDFAKTYNNRGLAYAEKKEFDKAIGDYDKAINLRPDYALVYCNRGEAWLHKKEWDKARKDLTDAKKRGVDIIYSFHLDYESVEEFEKENCIDDLREDLREMLTPSEENLSTLRESP